MVTELTKDLIYYFNKLTGDVIKEHQGQNEGFYGVTMYSSVNQPAVTGNNPSYYCFRTLQHILLTNTEEGRSQ